MYSQWQRQWSDNQWHMCCKASKYSNNKAELIERYYCKASEKLESLSTKRMKQIIQFETGDTISIGANTTTMMMIKILNPNIMGEYINFGSIGRRQV